VAPGATAQAPAAVARGAGVVLGVQNGGRHGNVGSTNGGGLVVVVGGVVLGGAVVVVGVGVKVVAGRLLHPVRGTQV
jgi:hypothetical protein